MLVVINSIRYQSLILRDKSFIVDSIFVDRFSAILTFWVAKIRFITPNMVTISSIFVAFFACYFFILGGKANFIIGGIITYFTFIMDGIDGNLARMKNLFSDFGAKLDIWSDKVKKIITIGAICYSTTENVNLMIFLFVLHYVMNYIHFPESVRLKELAQQNKLMSFFHPYDATIVILVFGTIFYQVNLVIALTLLIYISLIFINYFLSKQETLE